MSKMKKLSKQDLPLSITYPNWLFMNILYRDVAMGDEWDVTSPAFGVSGYNVLSRPQLL
jgi:hypothetical protein